MNAELRKLEGKVYIRGHYDMGNALYATYMENKWLKGCLGDEKAGDVVEALLALQWFQER